MKKFKFLNILVILALLALGFGMACSNSTDEVPGDPRTSTYKQNTSQGTVEVTFSNGSLSIRATGPQNQDNYVIKLTGSTISKGTVLVTGSNIVFMPSSGQMFQGSINNGVLSITAVPLPSGGTFNVTSATISEGGSGTTGSDGTGTTMTLTGAVAIDNYHPAVGDILTAVYMPGNGMGAASWGWYRGSSYISDSDSNTYTVDVEDEDYILRAVVSFPNQTGSISSAATDAVIPTDVPAYSGLGTDLGNGFFLLPMNEDAGSNVVGLMISSIASTRLTSSANFYLELMNISKRVYAKFKDDFDFIFYVLDKGIDPEIIDALGFYGLNMRVSNNVQGLGIPIQSNATVWGSDGKLKSVMYLPFYNAISSGPTLHELLHNWGAFICPTYDADNYDASGHWGVSNAGGQLGGFNYVKEVESNSGGVSGKTKYQASMSPVEKADGSFQYPGFGEFANGGNGLPYSDIELYLMGMKSEADLAGFTLDIYSGNSFEDELSFYLDGYFYSTHKESYPISRLISEKGARVPNAAGSQKEFKVLTVVLSDSNTVNHIPEIVKDVQWLSGSSSDSTYPRLYNFNQATNGVGSLLTSGIKDSLID